MPKTKDAHRKFWSEVRDYEKKIFSVFGDKKAENPIFGYLKTLPSNFAVADIGCGTGKLLPFLSKKFDRVVAIDYSKKMLDVAAGMNGKLSNVEYQLGDTRYLSKWYGKLDVAISVNSVLPDSIKEVHVMLTEIHKTLKKNGKFVAIMASADGGCVYPALLKLRKFMQDGMSEGESMDKIEREFFDGHKFHFLGFTKDDPKQPIMQKYFYPFEIPIRLKDAGFGEILRLEKVLYSWEHCKKYGYGYFPEEERIWDWFVVVRK